MAEKLEVAVDVDAPAAATWSVLTDWKRQSEWAMFTTTRGIGPSGGRAVGEQVHAWTGIGRLGFMDTMVVEAWEPPHRCRVRKTGRVVRGNAEFEVRSLSPTRATIVYNADVDLPAGPLGRLAWPLVRAALAAGFRRSLTTLGTIAAREPIPSTPDPTQHGPRRSASGPGDADPRG